MIEAAENDTVGDNAYRNIRNDIIFGQLKPSERLRLEPLRKRYNVSVTTLREILNRLTSDGFVIAEGQKGFEVAPVSDDDLREVAELRILLESHALKRSFDLGDLDWEAGVVAAYHKLHVLEKRMLAGETAVRESWKNADWQFHRALISGCGSRTLLEAHGAAFDKYLRYQMLTLTFRGEEAAREHKQLLDAALSHDANTAGKVLETHILGGVEHSIANRDRNQDNLK
ncbi:GntR family transcriptional regulator [Roseibium sp.]|uniref:GntR family transcriptional regulator n=1 Tax=Roseibium sp. TaxID=1936156 RepID=UPI003D0B2E94